MGLEENTIYRVVISPVQHFYLAVGLKTDNARGTETSSYKQAKMKVPNAGDKLKIITWEEYKELISWS